MKKLRLTAGLLAAALLLLSCGETAVGDTAGSGEGNPSSAEEIAAEEPKTERELRAEVKDDLPEKDYGGKQFRISCKQGFLYEIYTDEINGDICNDALWERNDRINERFNVEITPIITQAGDGATHVNNVRQSIMAADDAFDLAATYVFTTGPIITGGYYLNWNNMAYTDLSKPWWINGINDKFRVKDAIYSTVGDMCLSTLKLTYAIFFNRTKGVDYGYTDTIYQTIRDGEWTIDRFISMVENVYEDLNGNGERDTEDFYGFTGEKVTNLDVYTFAFDIPIIAQDEEGIPRLVFNTDRAVSAVELVNRLYWDGVGSFIPDDYNEPGAKFCNSTALFTTTSIGSAFSTFREMEDDYSILPYPKFDENQEKYMTGAMDNYSVLGVPITEKDPEMVSVITESLNVESYRTLFPTYYEEALQTKYARDRESVEMLNLLMEGRNFDFVTLFSNDITGMPWLIRGLVAANSNDFTSTFKKNEKVAERGLENVLKAYEANAGN